MNTGIVVLLASVLLPLAAVAAPPSSDPDQLQAFAERFWAWRSVEQPVSTDDIPRIERPSDWRPSWSANALAGYRNQLRAFEKELNAFDYSGWPVPARVDLLLLKSALARVHWELDVLRSQERNPLFYVDQTLGAYVTATLPPPPFPKQQVAQIINVLQSIPETIRHAELNLKDVRAPFAQLAIDTLTGTSQRLQESVESLKQFLDPATANEVGTASQKASDALEQYRKWLQERLSTFGASVAVGRENYSFFLNKVAYLPYSPDQIAAMGQQEWARSVNSQTLEQRRNGGALTLPLFASREEQIQREIKDEEAVRQFLTEKHLLTVPADIEHYRFAPLPRYLQPFSDLTEMDDFTGPDRLDKNGIRYVAQPSSELGYFARVMASDPRPLIVHEGVPGHYFQLADSWRHPDPIRQHYYDSSANEGIGFYAEEAMLLSGLFGNSAATREVIWNFMRLRALRVEVDVKLASGEFSIDQAAAYLHAAVPMDLGTARSEASFFATNPGQAISYQIGKLQIQRFLAAAQTAQGNRFDLQKAHDSLWRNGNVPIALQEWELLGSTADLKTLKALP
jgi:uncharacterized protein (DUF885 family)